MKGCCVFDLADIPTPRRGEDGPRGSGAGPWTPWVTPPHPILTSSFQAGRFRRPWLWVGVGNTFETACRLRFKLELHQASASERIKNSHLRLLITPLVQFSSSPHPYTVFSAVLEEGWAGQARAGTTAGDSERKGEPAPAAGA